MMLKKFKKLFLIAFLNFCVSEAIQWNHDSHNNLYWAVGCDFNENNLKNEKMKGENCGPACASTAGCTHFTWTNYQDGTCWMKKNSVSKENAFAISDSSVVCGVINQRDDNNNNGGVSWNYDSNSKLNWALDCDWQENNLKNQRLSSTQCGPECGRTSGCTHFTWSDYQDGTCWMKQGSVSKGNVLSKPSSGLVCGIMDSKGEDNPGDNNFFPGNKIKLGLAFDNIFTDNDYRNYDYISIWINSPRSEDSKNTDFNPYWHGEMIKKCKQLNKIPLFYAYVIAFEARAKFNYQDCDVHPTNNLCVNGANFLRSHRDHIVNRYDHHAREIARSLEDRNAHCIFLIEPDLWQYYGDKKQQDGTLSGSYMRSLYDDFARSIKKHLPNAKISWDLSAWIGYSGMSEWWAFFKSSPYVDFVHTSGGQGTAGSSEYKPGELKWSDFSRITGKKIIADCGYGIGGGSSDNCKHWTYNNKANRIRDGVVALTGAQGAKYNPPDLNRLPLN